MHLWVATPKGQKKDGLLWDSKKRPCLETRCLGDGELFTSLVIPHWLPCTVTRRAPYFQWCGLQRVPPSFRCPQNTSISIPRGVHPSRPHGLATHKGTIDSSTKLLTRVPASMGARFHFQNACYSLFISNKVDNHYEYKPGPGSSSGILDGLKT